MGDLTKNISRHEIKCSCNKCSVTIQDHELIIEVVQNICDRIARDHDVEKVRLNISSAARCYEYNRIPVVVGGPGSNDESQHPRCNAMDINIFVKGRRVPPHDVYMTANEMYPFGFGIGLYDWGVHIDTRNKKARW